MDINNRIDWAILNTNSAKLSKARLEESEAYKELKSMSEDMLDELEYLWHSHELLMGTLHLLENNQEIPGGWRDRIAEHINDK